MNMQNTISIQNFSGSVPISGGATILRFGVKGQNLNLIVNSLIILNGGSQH